MAQYRADSIACAQQTVAHDISGSDPARAFQLATRLTDDETDPLEYQRAGQMIGVDRQIAKVKDMQYEMLERCLTRSEERRVGKACVSPSRSRWSPIH